MSKFTDVFNTTCDEHTRKCICITEATLEHGAKIVIDPISGKHIVYCAANAALSANAWGAVFFGNRFPAVEPWKPAIVATCFSGHAALKNFEANAGS